MRYRIASAVACTLVAACGGGVPDEYRPREGDVVFQSLPRGELVDAIEGATRSPFSHCGLVVRQGEGFAVLEAFQVVKETPLAEWIRRGRGRAFAAYRLRDPWALRIEELVMEARRFAGRPYDLRYAFDDSAIYCSELVFKAFRAATGEPLGATQRLADLDWPPFESFIRRLEGGDLPLERELITPKALAAATQLEEVARVGW